MAQELPLRHISEAAHDLVGPINQISSLLELFVRRYRSQLDEEAETFLKHIEAAGARLAATADGLGKYFRLADVECRRSSVHFVSSLQSALFALRPRIQESRAEILFGDLPDVQGDPMLLTTLLELLIENSLTFIREGVPPSIQIAADCSAATCRFSIMDNGIGIDPTRREEVFLPFKKLNGHSYPGAGMGLTIARAIVDILGGKIWIAATAEPGTTIVFELPAAA